MCRAAVLRFTILDPSGNLAVDLDDCAQSEFESRQSNDNSHNEHDFLDEDTHVDLDEIDVLGQEVEESFQRHRAKRNEKQEWLHKATRNWP